MREVRSRPQGHRLLWSPVEVSRPEFSEVTWKVKALALGEGKPPFFVAMVCVL